MDWTDATILTVAMFAAVALLLLIGYSLLTLVISLVKYLETAGWEGRMNREQVATSIRFEDWFSAVVARLEHRGFPNFQASQDDLIEARLHWQRCESPLALADLWVEQHVAEIEKSLLPKKE